MENEFNELALEEPIECHRLEVATQEYPDDAEKVYKAVAEDFAERCKYVFTSEDRMLEVWKARFIAIPFDRTKRWNLVLGGMLRESYLKFAPVQTAPTLYDIMRIMSYLHLFLDFNLLTQVYCNIQPRINYRIGGEAEKIRLDIVAKWEERKRSILKGKMVKVIKNGEDAEFNRDISTIRALDTILAAGFSNPSFRVTPIGSTPALTDSLNLSGLGEGADEFLAVPHGYQAFIVSWDTPCQMIAHIQHGLQGVTPFYVYELVEHYHSKSDGDALNSVMFSRYIAAVLIRELQAIVLPRFNSVLALVSTEVLQEKVDSATPGERTVYSLVLNAINGIPGYENTTITVVQGPRPLPKAPPTTEPI